MLDNKEVLKRFEKILLDLSSSTNDFKDYSNKVKEFVSVMANKTEVYEELIYLWLDEKLELKQNDLKKIDGYFNIIENKKNCVNLLTAIVKGYNRIKFDLDDEFTHDFIKNLRKHVRYEPDDNEEWLKRISVNIHEKAPIGVRDVLFVMSYIHVEVEYNDILKKVMVYKVEQY